MRDRREVIAENFDGDAELYDDYVNACRDQFGCDAAAGDAACTRADYRALKRLAHSLKGILTLLGDEAGAAEAYALETIAADHVEVSAAWRRLRAHLLAQAPSS